MNIAVPAPSSRIDPQMWSFYTAHKARLVYIVENRQRILDTMAQRAPDEYIGGPANPYLKRWHLERRPPVSNEYLHQFMRSDEDRALHCHPWESLSVMLDGQMYEWTFKNGHDASEGYRRQLIKAGDIVYRPAEYTHRLEIEPEYSGRAVTVFITGPKIREWGFHCPKRWVPWQEFCDPNNPGQVGAGCGD